MFFLTVNKDKEQYKESDLGCLAVLQRTVRKKIKRERKQEKKARAEERHRQKFLGPVTDPSKLISSDDDDIHTVINETLKVLQI